MKWILILIINYSIAWGIPGPVAYWNLDEASGTAQDDIGENDFTITGATQNQDGIIGKCIAFDGDGDYGTAPDNAALQLTGSFTIVGWVNASTLNDGGSKVALLGGEVGAASLCIRTNGNLLFTIVNALKDVPQDVTDIKRELLGSEYTQGKGLIHEVSDNKQEITKLRERYNTDRAVYWGQTTDHDGKVQREGTWCGGAYEYLPKIPKRNGIPIQLKRKGQLKHME